MQRHDSCCFVHRVGQTMVVYARMNFVGHFDNISVFDSIGCQRCDVQATLELVEYNPRRFLGQINFECSLQRRQILHCFLQCLIDVVLNAF